MIDLLKRLKGHREQNYGDVSRETLKKWYLRKRYICLISFLILIAVIFVICVWSISVSRLEIPFIDTWNIVIDYLSGIRYQKSTDYIHWYYAKYVVQDLAPRVVMAVAVGALLSVCGAIMQSVTRNPLTDPYTIGISSAALLGVTISIAYGVCIIPFLEGDAATIANAFIMAMIPAIVILTISLFKKLSPSMMILIGIGMMYIFSSFSTLIKFNATDESLQRIYEWSLGTLTGVQWMGVEFVLAAFIFIFLIVFFFAKQINIMSAGDSLSQSLGINSVRLRVICFSLVSLAVAVAVCFTGTIGFVGLVAPHIARLFVGNDNRYLLPLSALTGAIMLVISDVIVRIIPGGIPVGVLTAIIGSPLFILILVRMRRKSNF